MVSSVTVVTLSQDFLADVDEIEAALVHITRPSAKVLMQKLITKLRKDGKALQLTSAVRFYDSSEASPPGPVERAATPPKITPVTKPFVTSSTSQNNCQYQTSPAIESKRRQERDTAATATISSIENVNTSSAPARTKDQETQDEARDQNSFTIDLSDVHPQPPIPKSAGHIKDGASKYAGVTFYKARQKWIAQIMIDGKVRYIGSYDNEEEAAVDYARAKFKYRNVTKLRREGKELQSTSADVAAKYGDSVAPSPEPVIPEKTYRIKEGASKYVGYTPRKKSMATKIARPNEKKEAHANWRNNYEIVKDVCTILSRMVQEESCLWKESGDKEEQLPWSVFVGHEAHDCKYLRFGKKLSYKRLIFLAKSYEGKKLAAVEARVHKFVVNTRNSRTLPGWKRNRLNELEFDILK